MSNIEFENLGYQDKALGQNTNPSLTLWLQKKGLASNEKQAFFILIIFIICVVLTSIYILHSALAPKQTEKLTPSQIQTILNKTRTPPPN